jgi:hypothetical protein
MITWLKKFLFDETAFVGLFRGIALGAGTAISTGMIDVSALGVPKWTGVAMIALGGFVRAGDKNAPKGE